MVLICSLFLALNAKGQEIEIDGFILGSIKTDALANIAIQNIDVKYDGKGSNWIRYKGYYSYTLYFTNDKLSKVVKTETTHVSEKFEKIIGDQYLDIAYKYGDPTMTGETYAFWRGNNYKISFSYSVSSKQYESLSARSIFNDSPTMNTFYACEVETIFELLNPN